MKVNFFPFSSVPQLSKRDVQFQENPELFKSFLSFPITLEAFGGKMKDRSNYAVDRSLLVNVIKEQYENAGVANVPTQNIESLANNETFTVITAHQPSLLTGPLYFIYKILSVINLAEKLNETYPESHVVPVFIIGSEDHDFEEINHLNLFGRKIEWENDARGPVGRMKTDTLDPVLEQVYDILGDSENAEQLKDLIKSSFKDVDSYNEAVFRMVHQLFHKYNIVLLVTDDKALKSAFVPHIKKEIFERPSQELIVKTQDALGDLDLKSQAHAREINFFYLQEGRRDRIELDGEHYKVLETDLSFTKDELETEIENHPDRFSPNVVMRPIYQETILPNLAYLGGGGEIAYWTERKSQFEAFNVSFPILVRRNSLLFLTKSETKQMEKYEISSENLFQTDEEWVQHYVKLNAGAELEFSKEFDLFNQAFDLLGEKAEGIDKNLAQAIKAGQVKQFKSFEQLSSRLLRTEKDRHETDIKKIRKLHDKIFPSGSLQERKDNFIPFYLKYGAEYLDTLKANLDPFNPEFVVISE
ncbi:bacillithiol biosynthesis cysteine-adding enzyme BshC [Portibacter lacus]|uniref:Putative cysteine ligase BshC n=1 Tax=Portibacter lacus TaxID=1099794 RepID=A0AA37SN70_9BACT|nr:bacillithiol biosynthesis cysteine-adding enzyme BshC [Portibacter lacus]GLR16504.1 putative cysteine ligase BshC [Portibacter lacus]